MIVFLLKVLAGWCGISVSLAAGWSRIRRRSAPTPPPPPPADDVTALVQPESWSQAAINEQFASLIPDMVTAEVFELDALINRRARGWLR